MEKSTRGITIGQCIRTGGLQSFTQNELLCSKCFYYILY